MLHRHLTWLLAYCCWCTAAVMRSSCKQLCTALPSNMHMPQYCTDKVSNAANDAYLNCCPGHCLQYADAHQLLASSLGTKSQLCRKCGSPLNQHTCSDVHFARLSASSSKRLSKNLPAGAAAAGSSSGSRVALQKQRNTVAAVRVCMVSAAPTYFAVCRLPSCLPHQIPVQQATAKCPTPLPS
jgi:hypothetical protein